MHIKYHVFHFFKVFPGKSALFTVEKHRSMHYIMPDISTIIVLSKETVWFSVFFKL